MTHVRTDLQAGILLDRHSAWLVEFASALAQRTTLAAYSAVPRTLGRFSTRLSPVAIDDPPLTVVDFPVQRGYFSFPLQHILKEHRRIAAWLQRGVQDPSAAWLLCCYPHYSKVAALWPGPVVYYATDLFDKYEGRSYRDVSRMEEDICHRASLVCPNSQRIADYLVSRRACDPQKILVVPNGVRQSSVLSDSPNAPFELPPDCKALSRPVAGVIGNMATNVNWELLQEVVGATPWLSWLFVGPASARIEDTAQNQARARLLAAGPRVRFVGSRPYGELKAYARGLDVAVLPYMKQEPTYSGSSTRFYEHLAACRPILATDGFAELLDKEPLLKILRTPDDWIAALNHLREHQFRDGVERARWLQSQHETWDLRAQRLCEAMLAAKANSGALATGSAR
jgi:glycosyltransferase involved in cell wall biosynthesis